MTTNFVTEVLLQCEENNCILLLSYGWSAYTVVFVNLAKDLRAVVLHCAHCISHAVQIVTIWTRFSLLLRFASSLDIITAMYKYTSCTILSSRENRFCFFTRQNTIQYIGTCITVVHINPQVSPKVHQFFFLLLFIS